MEKAKRSYPLRRLLRMFIMVIARTVPMSGYVRLKFYRKAGVDIEKGNGRCGIVTFDLIHPERIHIGRGCEIVNGCVILSHFYDVHNTEEHSHFIGDIHIGRNVYMGANVIVVKPVKIGDGAVIGAGSIVNNDIPPYEVWAGSPARFIKSRKSK